MDWIELSAWRVLNILRDRTITYSPHLNIKIAEAGPNYMRAEPHNIIKGLNLLLDKEKIRIIDTKDELDLENIDNAKFYVLSTFGSPQDIARAKAFINWKNEFRNFSNDEHLCGMVLEHLIYQSLLKSNHYSIIGSGPKYNSENKLTKPRNSEILYFDNKEIYKHESGAGFDLFCIHKTTSIPIGIESKNIREWIYPASHEVWRLIARACTLECLPVLISRKIAYITKAGLFSKFGILGFESNFQFFDNQVNNLSNYTFKKNIIDKDRLGFADIKLIKKNTDTPKFLDDFFEDTLHNYHEIYFKRFMKYKDILKKYAIDYKMAEDISQSKRFNLYLQFKDEVGYDDIDKPLDLDKKIITEIKNT